MSLVNLKKVKPPEVDIPDINSMTKEELLNYILDSFQNYYDNADIKNRAKYSLSKDFYQGVGRGFWECKRIINEIKGRLNQ